MNEGQPAELGSLDPAAVARLVREASDEQLAEGFATNRDTILDEVFRRMEEHFDPASAQDLNAVVDWKILDRPDGGYDKFQVVIENGTCSVSRGGDRPARVTFSTKPVDFLKLVTGVEAGPNLFMQGRLQIEGDLMFSAQLQSLFRIPGG